MIHVGKKNYLQIIQQAPQGVYLDGEKLGKILLPKKYVPKGFRENDWLDVFIYFDSEDRLIATTRKPFVQVGEFAYLKVIDVNPTGAFLDWGLEKDLFVPYQEQFTRLKKDQSYMVYVYLDAASKRITATTKIDKYLIQFNQGLFKNNEPIEIQTWRKTEIGYSVIINNTHVGLLYDTEIFQKLRFGQKMNAFIKRIREDDKIDVTLNRTAKATYQELPDKILHYLETHHGISLITDKSPPEEIYKIFAVSKANYKKALGKLYKERKILIEKHQIKLL